MKQWLKVTAIMLVLLVLAGQLSAATLAANNPITTSPTGYTRAEDVEYLTYSGTIQVTASTSYTVDNVVVNWGARGEECVFLSTYAQEYYTGSYRWDAINAHQGGTGTSDAYQSQLYEVLQDMMQAMHTNVQDYQRTRAYYSFTDCVRNDFQQVSSFYSGTMADGKWSGGKYNREHIWPKSKCVNTGKADDSADIMLLRPTLYSENSSRGNLAYGEGGGYYDPGTSVRGDCARMVLYGYVRWGNTGKMWGSGGVMESLDILLKWMEEDPVDTWEMGRNDSVQSITGVRNVFVDFPELAWLLFGEEVPEDLVTPSGSNEEKPCAHERTELRNATEADCCSYGYSGDTYCIDCGQLLGKGQHSSKLGDHQYSEWMDGGSFFYRYCSVCGKEDVMPYNCVHETEEIRNKASANCTENGYTGDIFCAVCGMLIAEGEVIPATGHLNVKVTGRKAATCTKDGYTGNTSCVDCSQRLAYGETIPATGHQHTELRNTRHATCGKDGYTGDTYCTDCKEILVTGSKIPATGEHDFGEWVANEDGARRTCKVCSHSEWEESQKPASAWPIIAIAVVAIIIAGSMTIIPMLKKKRQ